MQNRELIKIADKPGLAKDPFSRSVICTDNEALQGYKKRRSEAQIVKVAIDDINKIREDFNQMQKDFSEIKELLLKILEK